MFDQPLIRRIAIAKLVGAVFVVGGALAFSGFYQMVGMSVFFGVLLYYVSLGAFVGMAGVMTTDLPFGFTYRWWWRGPSICAAPTAGLVLMFHEPLAQMFETFAEVKSIGTSPWMYVIEAALLGLVADFLCTKLVGEGPELILDSQNV